VVRKPGSTSLFFDFGPLAPGGVPRTADLEVLFGHLFGRLMFDEYFTLQEDAWDQLFEWGFFPFVLLEISHRERLFDHARHGDPIDSLVASICDDLQTRIVERIDTWQDSAVLRPHLPFINVAAQRYADSDFVSCIQVLYPRIEGVLRSCLSSVNPGCKAIQKNLARTAGMLSGDLSLLIPRRFEKFLEQFFFRNFNVNVDDVPLSRNTVAHGVSNIDDYNLAKATVGFLSSRPLYGN
jgi:hypothetical protein